MNSIFYVREKAFNGMNLKHFLFLMPEAVPAWLTGDKMETEAVFRGRNFSFISRGLTSGCSREFILIRNYFAEGSFFAAPSPELVRLQQKI